MDELANDDAKRKVLIAKGCKQAKKFSWQQCARETIAVYHKVGKR